MQLTVNSNVLLHNASLTDFNAIIHGLGSSAGSSAPSVSLEAGTLTAYDRTYPGGKLDATQPAPLCPQFGTEFAEKGTSSEDCLYLDIWAPASANKDSALPVRFWVYGGGNTGGGVSDPTYDGCRIPETGTLMVAVNYRLGPLGFLIIGSAGLGGNQAIQDILLALEWVQQNIASFGGDPKKVMLHGQSAGAVSAWTIASLPQAPQLISAAILESGGGRDVKLKSASEELGVAFAKALNCSTTDPSCLRQTPVKELQKTFSDLPILNSGTYNAITIGNITSPSFDPHIDGSVIRYQLSKTGVKVPTVFGTNELEGTLSTLIQFETSGISNPALGMNESVYQTVLQQSFGPALAKTAEQYFPISAFNSTPFPAFYAMTAVLTYESYHCPAHRGLNKAVVNGVPVWAYRFSHSPKCTWYSTFPQEAIPLLGATHTSEIPFVMGITEQLPPPNGSCSMTADERAISAFMTTAWTTMAAAQKPTTDDSAWPRYTGPQQSMGLSVVNSTFPAYINYTACDLWDKIEAGLLAATGNGTGGNASSPGTTPSGSNGSTTAVPPTPGASSNTSTSNAALPAAGVFGLALIGFLTAGILTF